MNTRRLYMLHDTHDVDIISITDRIDLGLLSPLQELIDQDPIVWHVLEDRQDRLLQFLVIDDNFQFAIHTDKVTGVDKVYVIEANPRAARTTPFIAKAYKVPYLTIATQVMMGVKKLKDFEITKNLEGYAIKVPVFSFDKFPNVDKRLGPEMKSTGEMIRFIKDLKDPYFRELDRNRSMYLYN